MWYDSIQVYILRNIVQQVEFGYCGDTVYEYITYIILIYQVAYSLIISTEDRFKAVLLKSCGFVVNKLSSKEKVSSPFNNLASFIF